MHVAVSEFARNVAGMEGANSTEMDLETPFPVIDLLPEQKEIADMGGTMRLGADPVKLHDATRIRELYGEAVVYERHRHRYEVNNHLRKKLEAAGLICSGTSPDDRLVEAIELARDEHPFYVASQYHPEFKSRPERPAPLFREFVGTALRHAGLPADARRRSPRHRRRAGHHRLARRVRRTSARRARAAARDVRGAVRDREPVLPRAGVRRLGDRAAARDGLEVDEDGSGPAVGSDSGNLFARIPGRPDAPSVLICAHLDTVPPVAPIEPVLVDGYWENANEAILGADNKSAVAVIARAGAPATRASRRRSAVELLFTVCEEVSLRGSREFDVSRLRSAFGYVFDHATPIGELVVASPTHYRIVAEFRGRAAHAGVRPEAGRSAIARPRKAIAAMRLGRLDAQTTANVGMIEGGTAINVVPERCRVEAEVRSLDDSARRGGDHRDDRPPPGRRQRGRVRSGPDVEQMFKGYRTRPRPPRCRSPSGRCAPAATSPSRSSPAAPRTRTRSRSAALPACAWPTAPSTTTSRASGSASRRSRSCSSSRSPWSTRPRVQLAPEPAR